MSAPEPRRVYVPALCVALPAAATPPMSLLTSNRPKSGVGSGSGSGSEPRPIWMVWPTDGTPSALTAYSQ